MRSLPLTGRSVGPAGLVALALAASLLCSGCTDGSAPRVTRLVLASTTSLYDSGLLDVLLPEFEAAHAGIDVQLVAVGSGHALELGRRGDADALLVHAPEDELDFMAAGHGRHRTPVMHNDFVIVGPETDPAGVRDAASASDAMRRVALGDAPFISRGDDSGTHRAELRLWHAAGHGRIPTGAVRVEVGQGMGETLAIASERGGYTLTDRATFVTLARTLHLVLLLEDPPTMVNAYSVITTARGRNHAAADSFALWLVSPEAAAVIDHFGPDRFGQRVFIAGPPPDSFRAAGPGHQPD
jgi:tungstate transport system substrate-binding protein